jgi:hypothetical protein
MSEGRPLLETLEEMTAASVLHADLEARELMLVRLAGLVAVEASPASYFINLGPAADTGISLEDARSLLIALAPIVGGPRVVVGAEAITAALGYALAIDELLNAEE